MTPGTAISKDGTRIAFWREGHGPPMLLVHGGASDHMAWYFVVPLLARYFEVFIYDRRGRGGSGDTVPYAVEREVEDVAAVLDAIGRPAHLVGHSAGGILALLAAGQTANLLSLTLYEPAFVVDGARQRPSPAVLAAIKSLLAQENRAEVIRIVMRETLELPEEQIAAMRAGPGWEHLLAVAHTVPYDWEVWMQPFNPQRAHTVAVPALVLQGSGSPSWLRQGARAVASALPCASLQVLPGQEHLAAVTAPRMFADAVANFARRVSESA